jgi:hypothetical protein
MGRDHGDRALAAPRVAPLPAMGHPSLSAWQHLYATNPLRLSLWAKIGPRAGWIILILFEFRLFIYIF